MNPTRTEVLNALAERGSIPLTVHRMAVADQVVLVCYTGHVALIRYVRWHDGEEQASDVVFEIESREVARQRAWLQVMDRFQGHVSDILAQDDDAPDIPEPDRSWSDQLREQQPPGQRLAEWLNEWQATMAMVKRSGSPVWSLEHALKNCPHCVSYEGGVATAVDGARVGQSFDKKWRVI